MLKIFLIISLGLFAGSVQAQSLTEQIGSTQTKISELEREIAKYEKELVTTERHKNDLSKALKTLELSRKKLEAETSLTINKIDAASLGITDLARDIGIHNNDIGRRLDSLADSMRGLYATLDRSPIEIILSESTFANSVNKSYELMKFQD